MALEFEKATAAGTSSIFDATPDERLGMDDGLERALAAAMQILAGDVKVLSPEDAERDRIGSRERRERLLARAKCLVEQPSVE